VFPLCGVLLCSHDWCSYDFGSLISGFCLIDVTSCAGVDGYVDGAKMNLFAQIARLVHQGDYLPIEMVCQALTGTSGADDVTHAYSDPSWKIRHKAYDTMSPEQVRAAARSARHTDQLQARDDIHCSAFAIIAPQDSALYNRMHTGLQSEYEKARKRKLEALEDNEPPQQQDVAPAGHSGEDASADDDMMAFLGF
jgi:hypothetical protein